MSIVETRVQNIHELRFSCILSELQCLKNMLVDNKPKVVKVTKPKSLTKKTIYSLCPRFSFRKPHWLEDRPHCQWLEQQWASRGKSVQMNNLQSIVDLINWVNGNENLYEQFRSGYQDPSWMTGLSFFDAQMNGWGFGNFLKDA